MPKNRSAPEGSGKLVPMPKGRERVTTPDAEYVKRRKDVARYIESIFGVPMPYIVVGQRCFGIDPDCCTPEYGTLELVPMPGVPEGAARFTLREEGQRA